MKIKLKNILDNIGNYIIAFSFILVCTISTLGVVLRVFSPDTYGTVSAAEGWFDEHGNPFSLNAFNNYDGVNMLPQKIYKNFEIKNPDTSIIFRCRNCYCNTYINGRLVDEDKKNTSVIYGSSPGSRWHIIAIDTSDKPVELCLEVTACFHNSNGLIDNIYIGSTRNVYRQTTTGRLLGYIISVFLHLLSIIMLFLYFYLKKYHNIRKDMLYLGIAAFFSAQWSSAESFIWQLLIGYSEVFHLIGYLSLAAIPLAFGVPAIYRLKGKIIGALCRVYSMISAINLITITILHVTGILEFHYSLPFTHVLIVILIPLMIMVVSSYTNYEDNSQSHLLLITLSLIIIVCLITSLIKYYIGSYNDYSSYIRISILCFLFCLIVYQLNQMASTFSKGLKADMLHDMALTDHMTGLYNRTAFNEHMPDYNHMIDSFSPLGVIQFDVNNLKRVNDTLGHEKGDQMIKCVAEGLKIAFGDQCNIYRTGGDEFLTIIQSLDPSIIYNEGLERLQKYCDEHNSDKNLGFKLHIAHGFVIVKGNMSLSEAIDEADALMYENKREIKQREKENE